VQPFFWLFLNKSPLCDQEGMRLIPKMQMADVVIITETAEKQYNGSLLTVRSHSLQNDSPLQYRNFGTGTPLSVPFHLVQLLLDCVFADCVIPLSLWESTEGKTG
jgi:hypothetical protein